MYEVPISDNKELINPPRYHRFFGLLQAEKAREKKRIKNIELQNFGEYLA